MADRDSFASSGPPWNERFAGARENPLGPFVVYDENARRTQIERDEIARELI